MEVFKLESVHKRKKVIPNFKPLKNLHLELLEIPKKLSPSAAPIIITKTFKIKKPEKFEKITFEKPIEDDVNSDSSRSSKRHKSIHLKHEDHDKREEIDDYRHPDHSEHSHHEEDDYKDLEHERYKESRHREVDPEVEREPEQEPEEIDTRTPEQRDADTRDEYKWKLIFLKRAYTDREIRLPEDHEELPTVIKYYNELKKELFFEKKVSEYSRYLTIFWISIEIFFTYVIGYNLAGYTASQKINQREYDMLLFELGEKNYSSYESKWSVEMRLLALVVTQTAMFFICKVISDKFDPGLADLFRSTMGLKTEINIQKMKEQRGDAEEKIINEELKADGDKKDKKMRGPKRRS